MDEASAYATMDKLNHSHIARMIETIDDGEHITIVTECCEGGDLIDRVLAGEGLSMDVVLRYAAHLTDALAHIHAAGYAHGDIKIDNCCISREGKLQLVDFGCSVRIADLGDSIFVPGSSTKAYTAPEVFTRRCADPCAADVWAAGVAIVVLATGWLPWETATSHSHAWLRHWRGEDIFRCLPDDLHKIVHSMLRISPRERATAADAHRMIVEAMAARSSFSQAA
jgi:serine/threonine protein kinase